MPSQSETLPLPDKTAHETSPQSATKDAMFSLAQYPDLPKQYKLRQLLGEGAFSSVYKAVNQISGDLVAIKIINKQNLSPKQLANIHNEISVMNTLANAGGHVNVLRLVEAFDTPENCFLVLDYCDGGEIFNKIIEYTYFLETLAKHVFLQLVDAIRYMHEQNVVHRDIKPENLLFKHIPYAPRPAAEHKAALRKSDDEAKVDEGAFVAGVGGGSVGIIKIADFGLAKQLKYDPLAAAGKGPSNLKTPCGTAGYTAPEVIHCGVERKRRFKSTTSKSNYYSKAVDIWLLGCFLYTILCGFPPFYDDNHDVLTHKILAADYVYLEPWWDEISAEAKHLISRMLVVNPEERITIDEIYQHPWLSEAVPLKLDSYFPETASPPLAAPPATFPSVSPSGSKSPGGLAMPGNAIKLVFNNPAMSHVNLKRLAQHERLHALENVDPQEVRFDSKTVFLSRSKTQAPRTPNPVLTFTDVFGTESDDLSSLLDYDEEGDAFDEQTSDELLDKLASLKYLLISSTSSSDSLKLLNNTTVNDENGTRSSSVISGINGEYKFTLSLNDLNLLRRRSSVKSGHNT